MQRKEPQHFSRGIQIRRAAVAPYLLHRAEDVDGGDHVPRGGQSRARHRLGREVSVGGGFELVAPDGLQEQRASAEPY